MADTKLSALTELAATPANDDEVYIRDVSEIAADESKRITITNLMGAVHYARLTVLYFRENPATGTMTTPSALNDDDMGTTCQSGSINEYAQVLFNSATIITQWRQYGDTNHTGDGRYKIQILDASGTWVDWQTDIPVRVTADYGGWDSSAGEVVTAGIK